MVALDDSGKPGHSRSSDNPHSMSQGPLSLSSRPRCFPLSALRMLKLKISQWFQGSHLIFTVHIRLVISRSCLLCSLFNASTAHRNNLLSPQSLLVNDFFHTSQTPKILHMLTRLSSCILSQVTMYENPSYCYASAHQELSISWHP